MNYKVGDTLRSIKNGYEVKIVEVGTNLGGKKQFKLEYVDGINVYKTVGEMAISKYYELV